MPARDLILQQLVDQAVLLDHWQALELVALYQDGEHRAATTGHILHLQVSWLEVVLQLAVDLLLVGVHGLEPPGNTCDT